MIGPILRTSPFIQKLVEKMTEGGESGQKKAKYDVWVKKQKIEVLK